MQQKILIIENDALLGEAISKTLRDHGYEVTWSKEAEEGMQKMHEVKPELVLLDMKLDTMDGYQILEAKAKEDGIKDIPVIIISNSGQPVEISRVLALGASDYIVKAQFSIEDVLEKVKNELGMESTTTPTSSGESLTNKTILWVEDDKLLMDIIARRVANAQCVLLHAKDGTEALQYAQEEKPDVIMLDVLLPGMDGIEILGKLKANEKTKNIPVIMFSNFDDQAKVDQSMKLGAVGYFVKASATLDYILEQIRLAVTKK